MSLSSKLAGRFQRLDLQGKIALALVSTSLVVGTLIASASFLLVRQQIIDNTNASLEAHAKLDRREIELKLGSLLAQAESIASNTVTANALADSVGRETYLTPLLKNQTLGLSGASITLTNYRGDAVTSSAPHSGDGAAKQQAFAAMMQEQKSVASIEPWQGGALLNVVIPVIYRLSGNIEGAVFLQVPLSALLPVDVDANRVLLDDTGQFLAGRIPGMAVLAVKTPLDLPPPLNRLGLTHSAFIDTDRALRNLDYLVATYFSALVLLALAALFIAHFSARLLLAPIQKLIAAAEAIAATGRPSGAIPLRGEREFDRLAGTFNIMVDRLGASYEELESRVEKRTRDLALSRQAVERAGSMLREAVASIAQGFSIFDENDRLFLCNETYLDFHNKSRDQITTGTTFEEITQKSAERGQYAEAIDNVEAWVKHRVIQHQNANGQVFEQQLDDGRWLLIVEYRTPSGYIVGNRTDITALKSTTEALRLREIYLRATLDNLPFLFWLKNAEGRFLAVNQVFADACGQASPHAVVGLTDLDVWPRELAEAYRNDDRKVIESRREKTVEEAVTPIDPDDSGGGRRWIETYKKPVISERNELLGTVGFARDVTERRLAETALQDRTEQLNAIFELSPDGFVSFDVALCVKYANPAFTRMTGIALAQINGLDEQAFTDLLGQLCAVGARFHGLEGLRESATGNKPGKRTFLELSLPGKRILEVGLRSSETSSVSQILYFRDVTHETEVDQMKSEFLSTAAHELRTPMASIYGFAEVLLTQELDEDSRKEFLTIIFSQSELMASILNELLDLARIEARRGKDFVFEPTYLQVLVDEVVSGFKLPAGRRAPALTAPATALYILADYKKAQQAIMNVLSNAYKYSPDGGVVRIELMAPQPDAAGDGSQPGRIGIRIADQGIGMTPAQCARVCERFYRADTSGKIPGTGLGMSIVHEIVELHRGQVDITSETGVGSNITLWFPALGKADAE
jgi:PAS domain S-box-containing protein